MNKSIIIGYTDSARLVGHKIVAGPGLTTGDQLEKIWEDAKECHDFPKGIKFLERYDLDQPQDTAEFISDEVAGSVQNNFQARLKLQQAARDREDSSKVNQANFTAARKIHDQAASDRNAALGAVAGPRNVLASDGLPEKEKAALQKKVEELQPKADAAVAKFNAVLEQFNIVRNPKSTPEELQAAYIALGVIKGETAAQQ